MRLVDGGVPKDVPPCGVWCLPYAQYPPVLAQLQQTIPNFQVVLILELPVLHTYVMWFPLESSLVDRCNPHLGCVSCRVVAEVLHPARLTRAVPAGARRWQMLPSPGLPVKYLWPSLPMLRRRGECARAPRGVLVQPLRQTGDAWRRDRSSCNSLLYPTTTRRTRFLHRWLAVGELATDHASVDAAAMRRTRRRVQHSARRCLASSWLHWHCHRVVLPPRRWPRSD